MPRDSRVYLEDILAAIDKVGQYTRGMSREDLAEDSRTLDAVVRNLEVIGEAAKSLPPEVRGQAPQVDWKRIAGLRDILIHRYFGIDLDIIWDVTRNKLPTLETEIRRILAS